jgi:hypothetical protein
MTRARHAYAGRRLLAGACLAFASCAPAAVDGPAPQPIHDVDWLTDEASATVFYRTKTSLTDCATQATEMARFWGEVVRPRLKDRRWGTVTLFPEEPSGRSASFTFRPVASGAWQADGPCLVKIPS